MTEIFYEVSDELRLKVIEGLNQIFNEINSGNCSAQEGSQKLSDFTDTFEDEYERAYCEFTIKILLEGMAAQYDE